MLETDLRIVDGGASIRLPVRYARVEAAHVTSKELEKACSLLLFRHYLAAKPVGGDTDELVVLSETPLKQLRVEDDEIVLTVKDTGKEPQELRLDCSGKTLVPALLERSVISQVARTTDLWRLDSPRKWLEATPFLVEGGIEAYRRFELSAIPVEDVGVGIAVDVSTAFFTNETLDYFFARNILPSARKDREVAFTRLTMRQKGQKGTLVYDVGRTKTVCYFEKADPNRTCRSTPEIRISGRTYGSLYQYYCERHPHLKVGPDEPAVLVSFRGLEHPVWVAARLLRIRVMNDSLPESLASVDKIPPAQRVGLIEDFWSWLGPSPFGTVALKLAEAFGGRVRTAFYRFQFPGSNSAPEGCCPLPATATRRNTGSTIERAEALEKAGAYHVPPAAQRTIHYACPHYADSAMAKQLAGDAATAISTWTGIPFQTSPVVYSTITEATTWLRKSATAGTVLFVLDGEPAAYYETAFQLSGWRLKRVTEESLSRHYRYLREGAWDRKKKEITLKKGRQKWEQYVRMNAYDLFQQMDGVPFRVSTLGDFEAALAIDVGRDRRYVAISLLVARDKELNPSFRIVTDVHAKTDYRLETINAKILVEMVAQLFGRLFRGKCDPLRSLLVLRDGEYRGEEEEGLHNGFLRLKEKGYLRTDAITALAEFHKSSLKNVRLWERLSDDDVVNPLEGSGVVLASDCAVLATTGRATLHQGTAEPLMIVCAGSRSLLEKVVQTTGIGAHLNWASPGVAQRLPLVFKRTDEELEIRAAQEVRGIA